MEEKRHSGSFSEIKLLLVPSTLHLAIINAVNNPEDSFRNGETPRHRLQSDHLTQELKKKAIKKKKKLQEKVKR